MMDTSDFKSHFKNKIKNYLSKMCYIFSENKESRVILYYTLEIYEKSALKYKMM